jgi:hypothetical protein
LIKLDWFGREQLNPTGDSNRVSIKQIISKPLYRKATSVEDFGTYLCPSLTRFSTAQSKYINPSHIIGAGWLQQYVGLLFIPQQAIVYRQLVEGAYVSHFPPVEVRDYVVA